MTGVRKKMSELKLDNYFVFTYRKNIPCLYKGVTRWAGDDIYLWVEYCRGSLLGGLWTQYGKELWVIDYGDELPDELDDTRIKHLDRR